MRKPIALLTVVALAGCGKGLTADEVRLAMPSKSDVKIGTPPGSSALTAGAAAVPAAAVTPSVLFGTSLALAVAVNGGTFVILSILEAVVSQPPASCSGDTCTWGPGSGTFDVNVFELAVTEVSGHFEYTLSAEPKSRPGSGFVPFLTGKAYPSGTPHKGHGDFTIDFDAEARLDHVAGWTQTDFGTLAITYDNRADVAVAATFLDGRNADNPGPDAANPNRVNAAYDFEASATGGDLQVAWRTLPPDAAKTANLHSRWTTAGQGRGDLRLAGGATFTLNECWLGNTTQFQLGYQMVNGVVNASFADIAACGPFSAADYGTLTAP